MQSASLVVALLASAAQPETGQATTMPPQSTAGKLFGQPSLNACAAAMEGIAWNNCGKDVDAYVYDEGNTKPRIYRLGQGKQRSDVPAGMRRTVIFCPAGWHPINPATGAVLEKPGFRFRCGADPKP